MTKPCQCDACRGKVKTSTQDSVTGSGFLASEQLGKRQSLTPEGFLLCEEVPIARAGSQDYAEIELPGIEGKDGVIVVDRDPDVVFSPETIASFEGKPITIEHPSDGVNPTNWSVLAKGSVHNVRRGEADQSDLLLADLLVTDLGAINAIQSKALKEVSCGYDADYEQIAPGRARQVSIVGNHVALVKSARCGPVCSIGDSNPFVQGADMAKGNTKQSSLMEKLRKAFMTRDADAFEAATQEMTDEGGVPGDGTHVHVHLGTPGKSESTADEDPPIKPEDDPDRKLSEVLTNIDARLTSLEQGFAEIKAGKTTADEDPDDDPADDPVNTVDDDDPDKKDVKTSDSTKLRDEFQETKALAEILAPGLRQPTYDAKAVRKTTFDAMCDLRRRALIAASKGENSDLVQTVIGTADISKMTCDSTRMAFTAAAALVKQHNTRSHDGGRDSNPNPHQSRDLNEIHREFWNKRK